MFNLLDYEREIRAGAKVAHIEETEALSSFIYNLTVMKPHFNLFGKELNFRTLGQKWNSLSSDDRNTQKEHLKNILSRTPHQRTSTNK